MNIEGFESCLKDARPPAALPALLSALWHDARGDWKRAHEIVQGEKGEDAAAVHAYLHRKEGDLSNADYWYGRARRQRVRALRATAVHRPADAAARPFGRHAQGLGHGGLTAAVHARMAAMLAA